MDYSDVNDYWFDWAQLERAEAGSYRFRRSRASRSELRVWRFCIGCVWLSFVFGAYVI